MKYLPLIILMLSPFLMQAQQPDLDPVDPYLKVTEISTNSRYQGVIESNHGIADHESELVITLVRAEIEERMLIMQGTSRSDARLENLRTLNYLLDLQTDIQERVNELVKLDQSGQEKPFDKIKELAVLENQVIQEILSDSALAVEVNGRMEEYLIAVSQNPSYTFIEWLFSFLTEKADVLRQSFLTDLGIEESTDSSMLVFFRLGAFVQNKQGGNPIHVENFDTYSPEQYSQSLSFSQPISEEEKEALATNVVSGQNLQQAFQTGRLRFEELMKSEDELFSSRMIYDTLKMMMQAEQQSLSSLQPVDEEALQVINQANLDLQQVEFGYQLVTGAFENLSTGFIPNSSTVQEFQLVLTRLQNVVDTAANRYDRLISGYAASQDSGSPSSRMSSLESLQGRFAQYRASVAADISKLSSFLGRAVGLLNPLRKNSLENAGFSEEVRRFTLGTLPDKGTITLRRTNARPGDDIVIRAVLQRGRSPRDRYYEEVELSRRVIRLDRISPHLKMGGSLILAQPYNPTMTSDTVALSTNFQFAPSYTIFLSRGSRTSRFYNQFLGFGLGLGFSSPDFNLDGTPEFGVSAMVTGLQDIVSAGWGWNFGVDTPYWYVGFNIPFTVGGIPNLGTSQAVGN